MLKTCILPVVGPDLVARSDWFHPDFESRTFDNNLSLQAMALKLVYENSRILLHRSLLPYSYLQRFGPAVDPSPH